MSLELGSRFRLPDGRLVEVVPDAEEILGITGRSKCARCAAVTLSGDQCGSLGCKWGYKGDYSFESTLSAGYPRILKEVENE